MSYVVFDIETVPNDRAETYFEKKVYEPAANLKDPEKIAASIEAKRLKDRSEAGLHWWTGKCICISARALGGDDHGTFMGDDEEQNLRGFFDAILSKPPTKVIGKSGEYFDTPFLVGRCLALDIGVPDFLRPYRPVQDIDHIFSFQAHCDQRTSLDNYAFGLGIEGKNGHGSEVAGLYFEKRWDDIGAYCERDVWIASEVFKRWLKPYMSRSKQ